MSAVTPNTKEDASEEPNAAMSATMRNDVPPALAEQRRQSNFALAKLLLSLFLLLFLIVTLLFCASGGDALYPAIFPFVPPSFLLHPTAYACMAVSFLLMLLHAPLYYRGLSRLLRRVPNTDTLVAVSTLAAFGYGMSALSLIPADTAILPAACALSLSLTLTFAAGGEYLLRRAQRNMGEALSQADALPLSPSPAAPMSERASVPGHIALIAMLAAVTAGLIWTEIASVSVGAGVFFAVLITACPIPIGLVEAVSLHAAMKQGVQSGLLFHDTTAIETAAEINAVVLGKSGFLTAGTPHITDIIGEGLTEDTLIGLAASAEANSYHPLAKAIATRAIHLRARRQRLAATNEITGCGVETLINGTAVRVGNRRWLEEEHIYLSAGLFTKADQLEERGKTVLFVSSGKSAKGLIAFEDEVRPEIPAMLKAFAAAGIEMVLLTGDSLRTAKAFARHLHIPKVRADVPPAEKAKAIQLLQVQGLTVALLDHEAAPDTAQQADLTVTLCPASPLPLDLPAEKNSRMVFTAKNFTVLPHFFALSRRATTAIRQNYLWAFGGSILAMPAALGLLSGVVSALVVPLLPLLASLPALLAILVNAHRVRL